MLNGQVSGYFWPDSISMEKILDHTSISAWLNQLESQHKTKKQMTDTVRLPKMENCVNSLFS